MSRMGTYILGGALTLCALTVDARLYRWVDEHGNIQYSDRLPPANIKDMTELDQRGMVRKAPEKKASAGELAQQASEQKIVQEQKRRDRALLQSFSRPEEIDMLRDRQITAVEARVQTNKLRTQGTQDKLRRLTAQADTSIKVGKKPVDTRQADLESTHKELGMLDAEAQKMSAEIATIKERAEADKKRFLELRGSP